MYARLVDESAERLRELRSEELHDLTLAALVLGLALLATQAHPALAMPLFLGGISVGALGVRALWRRWDLLDRLADERDAYVIPAVRAYASREASMERRRASAALIRAELPRLPRESPAREAAAAELEALTAELDDGDLALDPVCAVACRRLLTDSDQSPFLDSSLSAEELRSRVRRIRAGFVPRDPAT
jgi:hypothetical protein